MPSYSSSMTLGQTIKDPIQGGIITLDSSRTLYDFFMLELNVKWEYILDHRVDTHDNVRQRSSLLFATILFCASKFASFVDQRLVSTPDAFLQTRLCSLARNLVVNAIAEGDRALESMQAIYLLVCWKDADDDVSYLHSGYAFRVLHDSEPEQGDDDGWLAARRRRTWLALFRQDRQQSLFFMRQPSLYRTDEESLFLGDPARWGRMQCIMPSDMVAGCSADLRRVQTKLRGLVQRASSEMLPCFVDLMEAELSAWRSKWSPHLEGRANDSGQYPSQHHLKTLVDLWEHSVRLNVASAILRHSLLSSLGSSLAQAPDLLAVQKVLSPDLPGLLASIDGAFGTIRHLLNFPPDDLRRAPDVILLLAPSAALFLCLLLCLPEHGLLGPAFQKTAVDLIRRMAQHIANCVRSFQDTVALHSVYLHSLVELLDPSSLQRPTLQPAYGVQTLVDWPQIHDEGYELDLNGATLQAAQVLADGIGEVGERSGLEDGDEDIYAQSLGNLLHGDLFWETAHAVDRETI